MPSVSRSTVSDLTSGELAREAAEHLAVLAEERQQRIEVDTQDSVHIYADRLLLRRALLNLLDNAIKYAPPDSAIRLSAGLGGDGAFLEVTDQGPGIPAEEATRVFERFYRLDRARSRQSGGVGLGLAIARWAVRTNGGEIELESEVGRGSTFRIVLPTTNGGKT